MLDLDALMTEFQNEFKVCDKCKGVNLTTLIPKLQQLDPSATITPPACISYCGPGRDYPFVFLNNKPIKGEDEDDLIQKIKAVLTEQ
ncbi:MAG: YuzB family protein [Turicibacter sp.]|nr:YuzB family protein [Turicibacter sp.]